jgi:hypothetical protein
VFAGSNRDNDFADLPARFEIKMRVDNLVECKNSVDGLFGRKICVWQSVIVMPPPTRSRAETIRPIPSSLYAEDYAQLDVLNTNVHITLGE